MFDTGLLGAMCEIAPEELILSPLDKWDNFILENFVLQEIHSHNSSKTATWSGRTSKVELLIENDCTVIPIEIKPTLNKSAKSLRAYDKKYNPPYCMRLNGHLPSFCRKNAHVSYPIYLTSIFSNLPDNHNKLPLNPKPLLLSSPATVLKESVSDQSQVNKPDTAVSTEVTQPQKEGTATSGKGKQLSLF